MAEEIIYTMKGVSKVYPPNKYVLKDIYLSYFYGAKIGVLGLNGAGKSTLIRIMAGTDQEFLGEAFPARGVHQTNVRFRIEHATLLRRGGSSPEPRHRQRGRCPVSDI